MLLWNYQDSGYTHYRFVTVGDNCEHCRSLNGTVFDISDASAGKTLPPLHPNCDCKIHILDNEGNRVIKVDKSEIKNDNSLDYLTASLKQIFLGNYAEDTTLLGTLGQLALGISGLDLPADIRDLLYDITNWKLTPAHALQTLLDAVSLLPLVGSIKYTDEAADVLKGVVKQSNTRIVNTNNVVRLSNKEIINEAKRLGFNQTGRYSHGQPIFKKGNRYITPDIDAHNGGRWKMADSIKGLARKSTRLGTYDEELNRIGD